MRFLARSSKSGELDEISGQIVDFDGFPHVQHEDFAAFGVGFRLKDERDGLRNRHEVADDVRIRHADWAARFDLLLEERDDGAIGAEDVAETDRDEFRPAGRLDVRHGDIVVVEERKLRNAAFLRVFVQCLDNHFAEAFGGAHDVGRIDGFVRRDEQEAFRAVEHGGVAGLVCAEDVVLDAFAGGVLHERHMLVCRSVEDDIRTVVVE